MSVPAYNRHVTVWWATDRFLRKIYPDGSPVFSVASRRPLATEPKMAQYIMPATTSPMDAVALDGEVVVCSGGPKPFAVSLTPEAVLESLAPLREAAERAQAQGQPSTR
jgi:hypothetical protein